MPSNRSDRDPRVSRATPAGGMLAEDAVMTVVRAHGRRPPRDAVDWDALHGRIVDSARVHLARRARVASSTAARHWWEVTAAWARPALAAAVVVSVISGAAALATPSATTSDSPDNSVMTAWLQTVGGLSAGTMADRADATSPDSLYTAVVEQ